MTILTNPDSRFRRALLFLARTAFWAASCVLAVALCRRGLALDDEGAMLSAAAAILDGKVLYRDLDIFVTPGAWYLNAAIFALGGTRIVLTRLAAAACLVATMAVVRRVVRLSGGPLWGDFAAGCIAVFAVWAWPTWSWSFYSPWATLFSLAALACTLTWMESRRPKWLVACGVQLGLAIAFKQNYGAFAAAGCLAAVVVDEIGVSHPAEATWREIAARALRAGVFVAVGGLLVLGPGLAWLASQGVLAPAFDALVLRPFEGFTADHTIRYLRFGDLWRQQQIWNAFGWIYMAVPFTETSARLRWPSAAVSLTVLLHVALYWIPVFAFAGFGARGILVLRRRPPLQERTLLGILVFAMFFFLGVFPRADFNHLVNVYQPVVALLAAGAAVLFGKQRWRTGLVRRCSAAAAALLFLCFAAVAAVWMNDLRKKLWIPVDVPRAEGLLVDGYASLTLNDEIRELRTLTAPGEALFALPNLSMIPFLAERPILSRYRNYYAVHIGQDAGRDAAREIEASEARVVVASYDNFFSDQTTFRDYGHELAGYLRRNFRPRWSVGNQQHLILIRRAEPLPPVPARSLWLSCDVRQGGFPRIFSAERLLYSSLYHSFSGAWTSHNQAITTCPILVPPDARLRLGAELRQPQPAADPATVRAEVWVFPDLGQPQRVELRTMSLLPEIPVLREVDPEFEIDLSPWEGQFVTVMLRTVIDGRIPEAPFDPMGLALVWNSGRIESPRFADEE